MILRIST